MHLLNAHRVLRPNEKLTFAGQCPPILIGQSLAQMLVYMKRLLLLGYACLGLLSLSYAQTRELWQRVSDTPENSTASMTLPHRAIHYQLDRAGMEQILFSLPLESDEPEVRRRPVLRLPDPSGQWQRFYICESPIMAPGLAKRYPGIRTYLGRGIDDPGAHLRLDIGPQGLHASVRGRTATWLISPDRLQQNNVYLVYERSKLYSEQRSTFDCVVETTVDLPEETYAGRTAGEDLRVFRLAVAATGEYTTFHGGTVEEGLGAIVTAVNRVNSIYETELGIRLMLVEHNDEIIFTQANSDPFPDSADGSDRIDINQNILDLRLGPDAYDIGHLFDRRSDGGIASLGSVCSNSRKAKGYTSLANPVGDLFYVDYVSHEIGHQFGAHHTFNSISSGSCQGNRAGGSAYEPGSGSTIMGYAGLCPGNNYATRSDPYFHTASIEQISRFVTRSLGSACAEVIATENTPPEADAGGSSWVIPFATPFELEGAATDIDDDQLTYCWEEFDLGEAQDLGEMSTLAPLFRSLPPTIDPVRVFPAIETILDGVSLPDEVLPTLARDLRFRLTVRDNSSEGGGVDWDQTRLKVVTSAGPFKVTSQNTAETWTAGSYQLITWEVAGTDAGEVNTPSVDIYLSVEGGLRYSRILAENMPNTGRAIITVPPGEAGLNYRIKVKGHDNVFFDINDAPIQIIQPPASGIVLSLLEEPVTICGGDDLEIRLGVAALLDFDDDVQILPEQLPSGLVFSAEPVSIRPPELPVVTITGTEQLATGTYQIDILATDGQVQDTISYTFQVFAGRPAAPTLLSPAPDELDISTRPVFDWGFSADAESYVLQISTDPGFTDLIFRDSGLTESAYALPVSLTDSTTYYWQVRADNQACGPGDFSAATSFTTEVHRCEVFLPREDFPVDFTSSPFIFSRINVDKDVVVRDVNVVDIRGQYDDRIGDLKFQLRSAAGPSIDLVPTFEDCTARDSFRFELDTEAELLLACPYQDGQRYRPHEPLSVFYNQPAQGSWRLAIFDDGGSGRLDSWALEICYPVRPLGTNGPLPPQSSRLRVFPNPTNHTIQLSCSLDRPERVVIELYDLHGKLVLRNDFGRFPAGDRRFHLRIDELPAGMYVYRWWGEGRVLRANGKLIKL